MSSDENFVFIDIDWQRLSEKGDVLIFHFVLIVSRGGWSKSDIPIEVQALAYYPKSRVFSSIRDKFCKREK